MMTIEPEAEFATPAGVQMNENAVKAIAIVAKAAYAKSSVPILRTLRVHRNAGEAVTQFVATDLDVRLTYTAPSKETAALDIALEVSHVLPALKGAKFAEIANASTTIAEMMTSDGSHSKFTVLPGSEFPSQLGKEREFVASVPASAVETFSRVAASASDEEARGAILMSVKFEYDSEVLRLVATDGYQMALDAVPLSREVMCERGHLVPRTALLLLAKIVKHPEAKGQPLSIYAAARHLSFKVAGFELITSLVDGEYAKWQSVVPKPRSFLILNRAAMIAALKRAAAASGDRATKATLIFDERRAEITVEAQSDVTHASTTIAAIEAWQADHDFKMFVNAKYAVGVLERMKGESFAFGYDTPLSAFSYREGCGDVHAARSFARFVDGLEVVQMPIRG